MTTTHLAQPFGLAELVREDDSHVLVKRQNTPEYAEEFTDIPDLRMFGSKRVKPDVTVTNGVESFQTLKCLLCAMSHFFANLIHGDSSCQTICLKDLSDDSIIFLQNMMYSDPDERAEIVACDFDSLFKLIYKYQISMDSYIETYLSDSDRVAVGFYRKLDLLKQMKLEKWVKVLKRNAIENAFMFPQEELEMFSLEFLQKFAENGSFYKDPKFMLRLLDVVRKEDKDSIREILKQRFCDQPPLKAKNVLISLINKY